MILKVINNTEMSDMMQQMSLNDPEIEMLSMIHKVESWQKPAKPCHLWGNIR